MKNSEIEQYYFEMFRRDYPLPEGAVEYGDKPDVIVRGARTIGIEIRNFFLEDGSLPDGEQIQRKAREAVISKAHHLYQAQAGKKFELTFAFDRSVPIRDQTSVAQKIADLAATLQKSEPDSFGATISGIFPSSRSPTSTRPNIPMCAGGFRRAMTASSCRSISCGQLSKKRNSRQKITGPVKPTGFSLSWISWTGRRIRKLALTVWQV